MSSAAGLDLKLDKKKPKRKPGVDTKNAFRHGERAEANGHAQAAAAVERQFAHAKESQMAGIAASEEARAQ